MKSQSYMTRAMRARDPRFASILGKLGYQRGDIQQQQPASAPDALAVLRAEYADVLGKRPFHGWEADTLKAKIAEAKAPN